MTVRLGFVAKILLLWGAVARRAALIRKIEAVLLFFGLENSAQRAGLIIVWPEDQITGVAKVQCHQSVIFQGCQNSGTTSDVGIDSYAFGQQISERRLIVSVKLLFHVAHELFGKEARVDPMLLPAADAVSDDDEIFFR